MQCLRWRLQTSSFCYLAFPQSTDLTLSSLPTLSLPNYFSIISYLIFISRSSSISRFRRFIAFSYFLFFPLSLFSMATPPVPSDTEDDSARFIFPPLCFDPHTLERFPLVFFCPRKTPRQSKMMTMVGSRVLTLAEIHKPKQRGNSLPDRRKDGEGRKERQHYFFLHGLLL